MVEAFPYGYDRLDESTPVPFRKPLSQVRRDAIEEAIESGVTVEVLMNSRDFKSEEVEAYFSAADAVHPDDLVQMGGVDAA